MIGLSGTTALTGSPGGQEFEHKLIGLVRDAVHHPLDAITSDEPPYGFSQSYFQVETRWSWGSLGGAGTPFTSYHRPISEWFRLLRAAGFTVEKMLEPPPVELPTWRDSGWAGGPYYDKLATVPGTLIVAARKPAG